MPNQRSLAGPYRDTAVDVAQWSWAIKSEALDMNRERVAKFDESNISLAQELIRSSAFWIDHRQGITHPMPGMAERIERGPHGLQVRFGANKFLVGHAIRFSQKTILYELDRSERLNEDINAKLLFRRLITCVRGSVSDYADWICDYYTGGAEPSEKAKGFYEADPYDAEIRSQRRGGLVLRSVMLREVVPPSKDCWKGYMKFGVHAIKVDAFVDRILQLTDRTV